MASVSIAARDSLRGSTASWVRSQARSLAVRKVQPVADMDEVDAARRVFDLEPLEARAQIDAGRQMARQGLLVERGGCREQQRLQQAELFGPRLARGIQARRPPRFRTHPPATRPKPAIAHPFPAASDALPAAMLQVAPDRGRGAGGARAAQIDRRECGRLMNFHGALPRQFERRGERGGEHGRPH